MASMPRSPQRTLRLRQDPPPKEISRPIKTHKEHVAEMRGKMRDLGGAALGEATGLPRMRSVPSLSAGDANPAKVFPRMLSVPSLSSGERRFSHESRRFSQESEEPVVQPLAPQLRVTWVPARGHARGKDRDASPAKKIEVAADSEPQQQQSLLWQEHHGHNTNRPRAASQGSTTPLHFPCRKSLAGLEHALPFVHRACMPFLGANAQSKTRRGAASGGRVQCL